MDSGGWAHSIAAVYQQLISIATTGSLETSQPPVAFTVTLGNAPGLQHLQFFFFQIDVIYFTFKFNRQGTGLPGVDKSGLIFWK
jgi:hypothetical protein